MNATIPFNARICFTGAPESGLNELAAAVHSVTEAATGGGIPLFDLSFWSHPDSAFLRDELQRSRQMFAVADTFLGANGPRGEEQNFHLLRGPADVLALAAMQGITLPPEMNRTCSQLVERIQLFVFQLPDRDRWRARGFDERAATWFAEYARTVLETLRNHGLRLEQFRVLPPQRGDLNGDVVEACWRLFGVAPNPLKPTDRTKPLASVTRTAEAQARDAFEMKVGSPLGVPHKR
ncbi:MAG: hypothetical protein KIS67_16785 [Verrucomicrobiae bacterium]|nr:hypothetical protein [Verrucomicrobiae bacterium]